MLLHVSVLTLCDHHLLEWCCVRAFRLLRICWFACVCALKSCFTSQFYGLAPIAAGRLRFRHRCWRAHVPRWQHDAHATSRGAVCGVCVCGARIACCSAASAPISCGLAPLRCGWLIRHICLCCCVVSRLPVPLRRELPLRNTPPLANARRVFPSQLQHSAFGRFLLSLAVPAACVVRWLRLRVIRLTSARTSLRCEGAFRCIALRPACLSPTHASLLCDSAR